MNYKVLTIIALSTLLDFSVTQQSSLIKTVT